MDPEAANPYDPARQASAEDAGGSRYADLVLEGGGVKGIALAGAVRRLVDAGYRFPRIAGTSAGAVTAAFIAAFEQAGEPLDRIEDVARSIDYAGFRDRGALARHAGPLRPLADGLNFLLDCGLYEGDRMRTWLAGALADLGVRTFGDLRLPDDPEDDLPEDHRYRLAVLVSDVSRERGVMLPWDYRQMYGLDPDEQRVADAVRMSASIPFYFEPMRLRAADGVASTIVDGGLFSNYPITAFDRTDGRRPRWPTFGVRLSPRTRRPVDHRVTGPLSLGLAVVESAIGAWDKMHIDDPCAIARTIFVDTGDIATTDFDITADQRDKLLTAGEDAAAKFLSTWDFDAYLEKCSGGAQ